MPEKPVTFSRDAAKRIARVVQTVERTAPPPKGRGADAPAGGTPWTLAKAEETFFIGQSGEIKLYGGKEKGDEHDLDKTVDCYSRTHDVLAGQWLFVVNIGGGWEVIDGPVDMLLGVSDGEIAAGGSGTVSLFEGEFGTETDTGVDLEEVLCRFGNVAEGAQVLVKWTGQGYEIIAAECGSDDGGSSDGADLDDGSLPLSKIADQASGTILGRTAGGSGPVSALTLGSGGATALAASGSTGTGNIVFATSPTFVTPVLGAATATSINGSTIPSSSTLATTGSNLSAFANTTSAQLAGIMTDETGTGALVFANSPTFVTPVLGAATATSINGSTIPTSKTLTVTTDKLSVFAATTSAELAGVISDETGSGSLVFGTSPTIAGGTHTALTGLGIRSTGASFDLKLASSEVLTADRTLTLTLGDAARTLTVGASASVSGTNTGDQTTITGNAGTATILATARNIYGNSFNGSAALTQVIASTYGGTGNGFTKFTGPATAERTFTLPNADATILTTNSVVTSTQGGTGLNTYTTGDMLYAGATNFLSAFAGNTTTTKKWLNQTGAAGVAGTPAWSTIVQADVGGLTTSDAPSFGGITCSSSNSGVARHTFRNTNSGSGAYCAVDFGNDIGSSDAEFLLNSSNNTTYAGARGFSIICSGDIIHHQGGAERMRWKSGGDVLIGTSTAPTGTVGKTLFFGSNGGNPTPGSLTAGIFAKQVTNVEMFAIDSAGTATQLSKHYDPDLAAAAGIVVDPDDDFPQIDCEENPFLGLRALSYTSPATGQRQRITLALPPEECLVWDDVQDLHQAAHEFKAQQWADSRRAHQQATAKHALAHAKWDRLEPIAKVFIPPPDPPMPLDGAAEPGEYVRQECPTWIQRVLDRRKPNSRAEAPASGEAR